MTRDTGRMGTVLREGDRVGLRFVRRLGHPRQRVWRALTESEDLRHWMPTDLVGERREGAELLLPFWAAQVEKYAIEEPVLTGRILVWQPPEVFAWTWDTDELRFELSEEPVGTVLTFTTWLGGGTVETLVSTAAGYHACFDQLADLLDGGPSGALVDVDPAPLEAMYAAQLSG